MKFLNGRHSCQVHASVNYYSSVIRRKGESQNGYFKKIAKFSEKRTFLTPWYAHVRIRGKKCLLFGKFGVFCLLETPVLRFAFSLNTDVLLFWAYQRINIELTITRLWSLAALWYKNTLKYFILTRFYTKHCYRCVLILRAFRVVGRIFFRPYCFCAGHLASTLP